MNCINKKKISLYIGLATAAILGMYFFIFHYELSSNSSDWANLGSYFSGMLLPILTFVNILVFIEISIWLSKEDGNRALRQFRIDEIRRLNDELDKAIVPDTSSAISINAASAPIVRATCYIESFLRTKLALFNLDADSKETDEIKKLHSCLMALEKEFVQLESMPISNQTLNNILDQRATVINILQDITLYK
ncbi:MAG: hypothetical protein IJJ56_04985 [Prevotella sp.]|nr:hypothetical protein [Prevotella sp.]